MPNGQKVPTGQKYDEWLKSKGLPSQAHKTSGRGEEIREKVYPM